MCVKPRNLEASTPLRAPLAASPPRPGESPDRSLVWPQSLHFLWQRRPLALEFRPLGQKLSLRGPSDPQRRAPPSNGAFAVMSLNEEDVIMLNYDLSPFYRSTVGFDRLLSMLDKVAGGEQNAPTYPPYNIERTDENAYRITLAVAGFGEHELSVE